MAGRARTLVNWTAADDDRLRELWPLPLTMHAIADRMGKFYADVSLVSVKLGLPMRKPGHYGLFQPLPEGVAMRRCMCCGNPFRSEGKHNRLCTNVACRGD